MLMKFKQLGIVKGILAIVVVIGIVVFAIVVYIIVSNINKMPNRTDELCSYREENVLYEFAK